ncbi:URC4/urg3 family protein [Enterovirga sp. DB1703]|uniref:URC4/urg3 family protein n=2 Tax=Enterovirga aerilata TaxID=2730920 RepID=A0A849I0Z8_9HYPH|nr:URC4/urg3 family protein [Enterovirga sp. DB1703]
MLRLGLAGELEHFSVDLGRLSACADEVVATTRAEYPTLEIPFHARWRHFAAGGLDRWGTLAEAVRWTDRRERARAAFDLAIVSVLLDAGAGPAWRYEEGRTGETYSRSEGLAVASFDMFIGGTFSARPDLPYQADADALARLSVTELARGMQVSAQNPLVGLEGRASLLNRLGQAVAARPEVFGVADAPRPGGLFDHLVEGAPEERIAAPAILEALLLHLGSVWPGRIALGGIDLGDTWRHPALRTGGATDGLVPFHKLSQWLAYSLIEPLEEAGIAVVELDGLTGLPEYRNGGLLIDTGVLAFRRAEDAGRPHPVGSQLVVEWRALTVALLDRLAEEVRGKLGLSAEQFPLAKVLEGGTWATGRRLARERRPGGEPPIQVVSDGTVF